MAPAADKPKMKDSVKTSPSRSKPKVNSSQASSVGGKKFGSLTSFQPTLNFSALPSTSGSASTSVSASTSASSSSSRASGSSKTLVGSRPSAPIGRRDKGSGSDGKAMPPPPLGFVTKTKGGQPPVRPGSGSASPDGSGKDAFKGKGKLMAVIDISDGENEEESSSGARRLATNANASGMWAEMFAPRSEAELAPSKSRLARVKDWLHEALHGYPPGRIPASTGLSHAALDRVRKYRRILLLSGPAGVGKTTSVRVLAEEMGVELLEWGEGANEWSLGSAGEEGRETAMTKLSSFLLRNAYAPLTLTRSAGSSTSGPARPRVLLLSSLPNLSHGPTKDAFHAMLRDFCVSYTTSSCPLIIVHSDAGASGAAEESWRDRERGGREGVGDVLGRDVRDGPWCQEVDFLPAAPTFIVKALKRILDLATTSSSAPPPPVSALQLIAFTSNGDLRSAVNSLQLLCTQTAVSFTGTGKGKKRKTGASEVGSDAKKVKMTGVSRKGSRGGKGAKLDVPDDLRAVLDALTRREQSLHLFHALGKVFYNKRLDDPGQEQEDQEAIAAIQALPPDDALPPHLEQFRRRKSLVQMETFAPTIPLDASTFTLWLHQSLPSFCSTIEEAAAAADEMCAADIMRTDDDIWQSSQQAISYALHIAVRGAQMSLPSPVPRNHQKILKPQFFPALRAERKNLELLDTAAAYRAQKAVAGSNALAEMPVNAAAGEGQAVWGGLATKGALATEMVPMLVKMQGMTTKPLLPASVQPLRMPAWTGIASGSPGEELTATQADMSVLGDTGLPAAEEDEAGVLTHGWDREEETIMQEEKGWLEEDDIDDFD